MNAKTKSNLSNNAWLVRSAMEAWVRSPDNDVAKPEEQKVVYALGLLATIPDTAESIESMMRRLGNGDEVFAVKDKLASTGISIADVNSGLLAWKSDLLDMRRMKLSELHTWSKQQADADRGVARNPRTIGGTGSIIDSFAADFEVPGNEEQILTVQVKVKSSGLPHETYVNLPITKRQAEGILEKKTALTMNIRAIDAIDDTRKISANLNHRKTARLDMLGHMHCEFCDASGQTVTAMIPYAAEAISEFVQTGTLNSSEHMRFSVAPVARETMVLTDQDKGQLTFNKLGEVDHRGHAISSLSVYLVETVADPSQEGDLKVTPMEAFRARNLSVDNDDNRFEWDAYEYVFPEGRLSREVEMLIEQLERRSLSVSQAETLTNSASAQDQARQDTSLKMS